MHTYTNLHLRFICTARSLAFSACNCVCATFVVVVVAFLQFEKPEYNYHENGRIHTSAQAAKTQLSYSIQPRHTMLFVALHIIKPHTISSTQFSLLFNFLFCFRVCYFVCCWLALARLDYHRVGFVRWRNHVPRAYKRDGKYGQIRPCPEFCILFYGTMRFAYFVVVVLFL